MRIRRLRQARGWTQLELASRVAKPRGGRYTPGLMSRVENGYANPPIFVYLHLAEAFAVDPARLLGFDAVEMPVTEAEMTLLRSLRTAGVAPHEALARLAGGEPAR
jgi:transcriptional regulator with XRE-family HTH domain